MPLWLSITLIVLAFVAGILFNIWMQRPPRSAREAFEKRYMTDPTNEDAAKQRMRGRDRL